MAAATLLLLLASLQGADGEPVKTAPLPPGPGNPRNSGCDILALKDGLLLLVYARYSGRAGAEAVPELAARFSGDGGRTWTPKDVPVARAGAQGPSLVRMGDGTIGLFHLWRVAAEDCRPVLRRSDDEARTWSPPVFLTAEPGIYDLAADRAVRLRGGRLVLPAVRRRDSETVVFFLSDDDGASWRRAPVEVRGGLREPLVVERKDGRLLLLAAAADGVLRRARSSDGGESWSGAEPADLPVAGRGLAAGRIPGTGDLLLVRALPPGAVLTASLSRDDGESWGKPKALEEDRSAVVGDAALEFPDGRVLVAYGAGDARAGALTETRVVLFDVPWLYR